jgi:formylglycine-generating enzyme required for sulfatase activity
VWVDGEKLTDESPLVTPALCSGPHEVKVKAEGYAVQTLAVEVPGNAMVTKTVALGVARTPGSTFRDPLADGTKGPEMVVIGAGAFLMGSPASEPERETNEGPQHQVVIAEPFAIGKYEVTFEEYDRFARATGRALPDDEGWGRGRRPVIAVSWDDATAYAQWLSAQSGRDYRLPSEAEWEYAARAGTLTPFWTGNCIHTSEENYDGDRDYNWCGAKTGVDRGKTLPVGSLQANPWGLYDTAGNVWEWTEDCWNDDYQGAPTAGGAWRHGNCALREERGKAITHPSIRLSERAGKRSASRLLSPQDGPLHPINVSLYPESQGPVCLRSSQGFAMGVLISSKWRVLPVARIAWRASQIPAICVSRMSTGRPFRRRSPANRAA